MALLHTILIDNRIEKQADRQTDACVRCVNNKNRSWKNMRCDWPFYVFMFDDACWLQRELIKKNRSRSQCCCFSWCWCRLPVCETHPLNRLLIYTFLRTSHSDNRFAGLIHINCIYEPNSTASIFSLIFFLPSPHHFRSSSLSFSVCISFIPSFLPRLVHHQQHKWYQMMQTR